MTESAESGAEPQDMYHRTMTEIALPKVLSQLKPLNRSVTERAACRKSSVTGTSKGMTIWGRSGTSSLVLLLHASRRSAGGSWYPRFSRTHACG